MRVREWPYDYPFRGRHSLNGAIFVLVILSCVEAAAWLVFRLFP